MDVSSIQQRQLESLQDKLVRIYRVGGQEIGGILSRHDHEHLLVKLSSSPETLVRRTAIANLSEAVMRRNNRGAVRPVIFR